IATALFALTAPAALARPAAPPAGNASADRSMHWYRWSPQSRRTRRIGPTAVLGVESMRDLAALRARYGFRVLHTFPKLRAAAIAMSRALRTGAADERRIRYLAPSVERHVSALPDDPLLSEIDRWTQLPYEWQFAAAHVDRALEISPGSPSILVGTIDSGAAAVPD